MFELSAHCQPFQTKAPHLKVDAFIFWWTRSQHHLDFLAHLQMYLYYCSFVFSNLAGSQILGSHPSSLDSLETSLYCLVVSGGAERAESRQIFLPLW